jgi:UDP-glucose 6-dehydrogenase
MIGFVGLSHLGLVYSLASAARGFEVVAYEPDPDRGRQLSEGNFPIEEPGLRELFAEHRARLPSRTTRRGWSRATRLRVARHSDRRRNQSDLSLRA